MTLTLSSANSAVAATGNTFDPNEPKIFVNHGNPTQLAFTADKGDGTIQLISIGSTQEPYNSLAFNPEDNYLYATSDGTLTTGDSSKSSQLLRIDKNGAVENLGVPAGLTVISGTGLQNTPYNQGTFGFGADAGKFFIASPTELWVITGVSQASAGQPAVATKLSSNWKNTRDMVYRDGYIWTLDGGAKIMYRYKVSDRTLTSHSLTSLPIPAHPYGGQWLFGNGNLGITSNTDGKIYQIAIDNPNAATPTFRVVSTAQGIPTGNNDAASIKGSPANLALTQSGGDTFTEGGSYSYTFTVTNSSGGTSSGSSFTAIIPTGLQSPTAPTGCSIVSGVLTCNVTSLANGESKSFVLTGTVGAGATKETLTSTATLVALEADPNLANNFSTFVPGNSDLAITQTGESLFTPGEPYTFTFTVENKGEDDSSGSTVTVNLPSGLLNPIAPNGCTISGSFMTCTIGPLAVGASTSFALAGTVAAQATTETMTASALVVGFENDSITANNSSQYAPENVNNSSGPTPENVNNSSGPTPVNGKTSPTLADTGSDLASLTILSVSLLLGGIAARFFGRREKRS